MKKLSFKLSFILLTLVILSAHSCGRRDHDKNGGGCHNPKPQTNTVVSGTWKLQNVSGGIAGGTQTPTKNITLTIGVDNTYFFVTDGVKTSQGTYSVNEKTSQIHKTTKQFLDFSNDGSFILDNSINNQLGLGQDAYDGQNYAYVR
jgi:hypothetical protein